MPRVPLQTQTASRFKPLGKSTCRPKLSITSLLHPAVARPQRRRAQRPPNPTFGLLSSDGCSPVTHFFRLDRDLPLTPLVKRKKRRPGPSIRIPGSNAIGSNPHITRWPRHSQSPLDLVLSRSGHTSEQKPAIEPDVRPGPDLTLCARVCGTAARAAAASRLAPTA